ncbi:hypothetical protein QEN19_003182 [Hanseniaspora menglaensis]
MKNNSSAQNVPTDTKIIGSMSLLDLQKQYNTAPNIHAKDQTIATQSFPGTLQHSDSRKLDNVPLLQLNSSAQQPFSNSTFTNPLLNFDQQIHNYPTQPSRFILPPLSQQTISNNVHMIQPDLSNGQTKIKPLSVQNNYSGNTYIANPPNFYHPNVFQAQMNFQIQQQLLNYNLHGIPHAVAPTNRIFAASSKGNNPSVLGTDTLLNANMMPQMAYIKQNYLSGGDHGGSSIVTASSKQSRKMAKKRKSSVINYNFESDSSSTTSGLKRHSISSKSVESVVDKDELILQLQDQVQFYKEQVFKYKAKDETENREARSIVSNLAIERRSSSAPKLKKSDSKRTLNDLIGGSDQSEKELINDALLPANVKENIFEDDYIVKRDKYINNTFTKNINGNKNISFYQKMVDFKYNDEFQKKQANAFIKLIIKDENNINFYRAEDKEKNEHSVNEAHDLKSVLYPFKFANDKTDYKNIFVENEVLDQPTILLNKIIETLNSKLPHYESMNFLKTLYIKELYVSMPCFDLAVLESFLNEVLVVDKNTGKITVNLAGSNIKDKLANIAVLCLLFKISTSVLKYSNTKFNDNLLSNEDYFELAVNILFATDPENYQSEHIISALSLVWAVYFFLPNSNPLHDSLTSSSNAELAVYIFEISLKFDIFNLHKLPSVVSNPLRLSHLRKLKVFIIKLIYCEKVANGNISYIQNLDLSSYLADLFNTDGEYCDDLDKLVHSTSMNKLRFLSLINDCYKLFYTSSKENFSIRELTFKIDFLNEFVANVCAFDHWLTPGTDFLFIGENKIVVDKAKATNTLYFEWLCFHRASVIRLYHVLIVETKKEYLSENSIGNKNMLISNLFMLISLSVGAVLMIEKYFKHDYDDYVARGASIALAKCVSMGFGKIICSLLSFTIRTYVYRIYLYSKLLNEKNHKFLSEIKLADSFLEMMSKFLFKTCRLYSKRYRFYYFKSFKFCLFLDYFEKIYEDGTLYNQLFQSKENFDPKTPVPDYILNHNLMRRFVSSDFVTVLLKGVFDIMSQEQVQAFLNESEDLRSTSEPLIYNDKIIVGLKSEKIYDEFSFGPLFETIDIDQIDMFQNNFF